MEQVTYISILYGFGLNSLIRNVMAVRVHAHYLKAHSTFIIITTSWVGLNSFMRNLNETVRALAHHLSAHFTYLNKRT